MSPQGVWCVMRMTISLDKIEWDWYLPLIAYSLVIETAWKYKDVINNMI